MLSIKACLLQFSAKYKNDILIEKKGRGNSEESVITETKVGFTEHQEQMALDVIADLASYSEDERVKLRAAEFIRDDRQGRRDFANKFQNLNINVITFNEQLKKAWQIVQAAKEPSKAIDV